jgi:hypothetical protein
MKPTLRFTLVALVGLAAASGSSAGSPDSPARVEVNFVEPDKFSDAADGQRGSDFRRDENLAELKDYFVERASRYLAEGQRLVINVTDVDLAGEVEPWRTSGAHDLRIVKDIYTPRIQLEYQLLDASGAVLKEEKRTLHDMSFNMKLHINRSDRRVHEKSLIDDWLRNEFKQAKK